MSLLTSRPIYERPLLARGSFLYRDLRLLSTKSRKRKDARDGFIIPIQTGSKHHEHTTYIKGPALSHAPSTSAAPWKPVA